MINGGDMIECRSINFDKRKMNNCLVIEKPFFLAIISKKKSTYGKTLAVFCID